MNEGELTVKLVNNCKSIVFLTLEEYYLVIDDFRRNICSVVLIVLKITDLMIKMVS